MSWVRGTAEEVFQAQLGWKVRDTQKRCSGRSRADVGSDGVLHTRAGGRVQGEWDSAAHSDKIMNLCHTHLHTDTHLHTRTRTHALKLPLLKAAGSHLA